MTYLDIAGFVMLVPAFILGMIVGWKLHHNTRPVTAPEDMREAIWGDDVHLSNIAAERAAGGEGLR